VVFALQAGNTEGKGDPEGDNGYKVQPVKAMPQEGSPGEVEPQLLIQCTLPVLIRLHRK
jgi:hypothetical protein